MSISREAWIIVGLRADCDELAGVPLDEYDGAEIDGDEFSFCDPEYDCSDERIVGFAYKKADPWSEIVWDKAEVQKLRDKFKKVTGHDAKVYLSMWVC